MYIYIYICSPDFPRINLNLPSLPEHESCYWSVAFKWICCPPLSTNFVSPMILWWSKVYSGGAAANFKDFQAHYRNCTGSVILLAFCGQLWTDGLFWILGSNVYSEGILARSGLYKTSLPLAFFISLSISLHKYIYIYLYIYIYILYIYVYIVIYKEIYMYINIKSTYIFPYLYISNSFYAYLYILFMLWATFFTVSLSVA